MERLAQKVFNRQVVLTSAGHQNAITRVVEGYTPPGPNDVVVKVGAAGVAYGDCAFARAIFPPRPTYNETVLGLEFWGTVHEIGSDVTSLAVGDTVCGQPVTGTLADYWTGDAKHAYKVTGAAASIDPSVGATLPVSYHTAYAIVEDVKKYEPLQAVDGPLSIFIGGGSGAVGAAMIQMAKLEGWTVYTTCSPAKSEFVKSLGADHIYDYHNEKWTEELKDDLKDKPLHVVATAHSKTDARILWDMMPAPGIHFVYGFFDEVYEKGAVGLIFHIVGRMVDISSTNWFAPPGKEQRLQRKPDDTKPDVRARYAAEIQPLADLVASGKLKPVVHKVFPIEQAKEAMDEVFSRRNCGKVVVSTTMVIDSGQPGTPPNHPESQQPPEA